MFLSALCRLTHQRVRQNGEMENRNSPVTAGIHQHKLQQRASCCRPCLCFSPVLRRLWGALNQQARPRLTKVGSHARSNNSPVRDGLQNRAVGSDDKSTDYIMALDFLAGCVGGMCQFFLHRFFSLLFVATLYNRFELSGHPPAVHWTTTLSPIVAPADGNCKIWTEGQKRVVAFSIIYFIW